MNVINVIGTLSVKNDAFVLKVGALEFPLSLLQFAGASRGAVATVETPEAPRCKHKSLHGLHCMKPERHMLKHQFVKKQFKKKQHVRGLVDKRPCARGDGKFAVVGKKLCREHLLINQRAQKKAVATRLKNAKRPKLKPKKVAKEQLTLNGLHHT